MKGLVYLIQSPPSWLKTPPLSLVYLKNYLRKQGQEAEIIDLNTRLFKASRLTLPEWLSLDKELEENLFSLAERKFPFILEDLYKTIEDAETIGFSLSQRNTPFSFSLAKRISDRFPAKRIIFGGPHTFFLEKKGKLDSRNYWVIGEGEIPLCEILSNSKTKIYHFQEIKDLDALPFYDFSTLDLNLYSQTLPLLSSRGCPFKCTFCSEKMLFSKFRHHSPQYIIDQIKHLKNKYKTNSFVFCDSLINYKRKWLSEFCSLVIKNQLNIKWEAQIRIENNFPNELANLIKKSGCYNLFVGLESGSEKILKLMNKGFTTTWALSFFETLTKAKLHFEVSLIFGYPEENETDFQETLSFILENKRIIPKIAQANPFVDYLDNLKKNTYPTEEANMRVEKFLQLLDNEKIKYTKSFIRNLTYANI